MSNRERKKENYVKSWKEKEKERKVSITEKQTGRRTGMERKRAEVVRK